MQAERVTKSTRMGLTIKDIQFGDNKDSNYGHIGHTTITRASEIRRQTTVTAHRLRILRIAILIISHMLFLIHTMGIAKVASVWIMASAKITLQSTLVAEVYKPLASLLTMVNGRIMRPKTGLESTYNSQCFRSTYFYRPDCESCSAMR